jgi:sterol desaturase/sphingolipid hydroxylase (fatty acid hydroxylase superfamily)
LLGVHPSMFLIIEAAARIYGVLVHVHPRFVGKLGILDVLVVTPSVHRVHHGRDVGYLDTNYGEVLTVWDHLFGTWVREVEVPDYGVLKELDPGDFKEIQLSPWVDLWRDIRRAPSLGLKLRYALDAPGYSHDGPDGRVRALKRR